jgi:glycosyltransferase involved in cell wall biosynthesis
MTAGRPATRPLLSHVFGRYLPLSEVFTYEWMRSLPDFDHAIFASSVEHAELFPAPHVCVPQPEERAWSLAREMGTSAVVCHFGPQALAGLALALAIDRPVVTLFHGYDISRLARDRRWVERYRAAFALGVRALCISDAGRARVLALGCPPDQAATIHLGVDTRRFAFRPPAGRWPSAGPRRVAMVARLVPKKGVDLALGAMRRLIDDGLDLELRVIGDGPERDRLDASIDALRLRSHVTLLGAMSHDRTERELADAHLYVQPSVTAGSGDQEGIPVSLMEAQALGLPVVSTRHSGIPELIVEGETGLLVNEHDVEGLAAAIASLAADGDLAQRLAVAGRARVEQEFDRDRQAVRFARYLSNLIGDPATRPHVRRPRPASPQRILVLRTVPVGLFARTLIVLAHRHPGAEVAVLTSRSSAGALASCPVAGRIFTHEDGPLSLARVGVSTIRQLQDEGFDAVIVPQPEGSDTAFVRAQRVAAAAGARRAWALTPRDDERPLDLRCRPWLGNRERPTTGRCAR